MHGKLLLFGEHAVVYGSAAIATALSDVRIQLTIEPVNVLTASQSPPVSIVFEFHSNPTFNAPPKRFEVSWSQLHQLVHAFPAPSLYVPTPSTALVAAIHSTLESICQNQEERRMLCPAVFMACALLPLDMTPTSLLVQVKASNLPMGAGLGSSAAFCVALAGGFYELTHHGQQEDRAKELSKETLETINRFAFAGEVLLHGSPSGVDNFTSTFGGTLLFRRPPASMGSAAMEMTFLTRGSIDSLRFLIVNTRVSRSTSHEVAKVRAFYDANNAVANKSFDEIDALAQEFLTLAESHQVTEPRVAEMMVRNQQLLAQMGVSHPRIEQVIAITERFGVATKLTGAGGGGCTVSLIPRSFDASQVQSLVDALVQSGFDAFVTSVGGPGFQIHRS